MSMKELFRNIAVFVGLTIRIFPYRFLHKLSSYLDIIYTFWRKKEFIEFGERSKITRKLRLGGGQICSNWK